MTLPKTARQISTARAKSRLADCLRKAEHGEPVIITRNGKPVAALIAVDRLSPATPAECTLAELVKLMRGGPKPDRGYWEALAAITRRQPNLPKSAWRR